MAKSRTAPPPRSAGTPNAPSTSAAIERALALPNGARFYRCALQVNPHGYAERFRGRPNALDEQEYIEAILSQCATLDIQAIALTDHGSIDSFDAFRNAATPRGVVVFPGFELTSSEGVHVLCIYDPAMSQRQVDRYLGPLGVQEVTPTSAPSKYKFTDILKKVHAQKGVTIAAHVAEKNGLFERMSGQPCIEAWQDEHLLAVQLHGQIEAVPNDKRWQDVLRNREPNYRRARSAADDLAVAVVNACDIKEPSDLAKVGASCWIKMSELSVEGLRQAFLDPGSRIRLFGDDAWAPHTEVLAMAWEGGFLDGAAVHFNGNLNVLVGGRGAGKSTVLESLRYALALDPVGDDARRQHEGVVRNVLGNGTKITVQVCAQHHPARMEYRIERTVPNPPVVRSAAGELLNVRPVDVMPGTEIYGQHEIAELTKSPEKLTRLLARFVPPDPSTPERAQTARRELERSRTQIDAVRDESRRVDDKLATLPAVEETLKKYQEAGVEARLHDQALVVREQRVLKTADERRQSVRELLDDVQRRAKIDTAFLSPKSLDGLPAAPVLRELGPALSELESTIEAAARAIESGLALASSRIGDVRTQWQVRERTAQDEYERVLRDLQKSRIDGQEFIRLRAQIEELRPLVERRALLVRTAEEHESRRRALTAEWEDVKSEEYRQLDRAAQRVSGALRGRVRVRVQFGGDRTPLGALLRELVGGALKHTVDALDGDPKLSIPELAGLCRGPVDALARRYAIPKGQAERLVERGDDLAMRIEELHLAPTTVVELNVSPEGQAEEWRTLDDLSSGQKATAVLLLLLLESNAPLAIDQPEDDLDNRFITDGIVPTMRREKRRRQFLVTTHNANIPVLGDAELIVGLSTVTEGGRVGATMPVDAMGSIDRPSVCTLVEELLEGGKDAFEIRRRKYQS